MRRRRELQLYVLRWDLAFLKLPFRGTTPLFVLDWITSRRLHFRLDGHHPPEACHHQKIVVIDDVLAVCGGIDMTADRWDTPGHLDRDPRRVRPNGEPYGAWHDATMIVQGEIARRLGELARERWFKATGNRIGPCPPLTPLWPQQLEVDFRDLPMAVARTVPEVVIVNPYSAAGWLAEMTMGSARTILLQRLREADKHDRLRFYTPVTEQARDIYVHAKVMVVDDVLLRVGSSNLNNRSMGLDTECDLAIEAQADEDAETRKAIIGVRNRLVAEHLGVAADVLSDTVAASSGRLGVAIDRLLRDDGRSLRPFGPSQINAAERWIAEAELLNSDRPETMSVSFKQGLEALPLPGMAGWAAGAAIAGIGLWLMTWRRSRRNA